MKFFPPLLILLLVHLHSFSQDTLAAQPKQHTASVNVQIVDTAFAIPQLHSSRRIWIYLPAEYAFGKKHYPVIYMSDGQNVFDAYTSANEEWSVDECLDSLINTGKPAAIVVAIAAGTDSTTTYDNYLDFLVQTLKPFIDKHYRTLSSKENTIIAGSSTGALMAYYAMLKYPDCFGKAGIFSPSFSVAPKINELTDSVADKQTGKFFFYIGGPEGDTAVNNMMALEEKLGKNSSAIIYSVIDPAGSNNEHAWRKWFSEFYAWIMADGFNNVIKLEK